MFVSLCLFIYLFVCSNVPLNNFVPGSVMGHGEGSGEGTGEGAGETSGTNVAIGAGVAVALTVIMCIFGFPMMIAGAVLIFIG